MFNRMKKASAWLAIAVATVSASAYAASPSLGANITRVVYDTDNNQPQLIVQGNVNGVSTSYFANVGTGSPCGTVPTQNAESVRNWNSLAQAALLSGKKVDIGYQDCGNVHWLQSLQLIQ